ncbi:MAG: glycosyltransferase family 2 protein [Deinococcales bacterium]
MKISKGIIIITSKHTRATSSADVSVVIVYWQAKGHVENYLGRCLAALKAQTLAPREVILVDNGMGELGVGGLEPLLSPIPLKLISLPKNLGFATANNLAAKQSHATWLALLNSDAFPETTWLQELIQAAQHYPSNYAAFASRQLQAHTPQYLDGAGDSYHISGLTWRRGYNQINNASWDKDRETFAACGAALLVKRDVFLALGGFEEHYFSYLEDVDLSFRLRLQGYRCQYIASAKVLHVGSSLNR